MKIKAADSYKQQIKTTTFPLRSTGSRVNHELSLDLTKDPQPEIESNNKEK